MIEATTTTTSRYGGKVAIVTGAAAGIGRSIVEGLVAEGCSVVANDIDAIALDGMGGDRIVTVVGDVGGESTASRLAEAALELGHGRIDALFNNAGIGSAAAALEIDAAHWRKVMDINVDAAFHLATAVGRVMVEQGRGAILNTASVAGTHGLPGRVAYVVSKHAIVGMTRALAVEWGVHGVRVNALCPGLTQTSMSERLRSGAPEYWAAREAVVPMRRAGTAAEQASFAIFLNSDDASYASGLVLEVDGGTHALYAGYAVPYPG